MRPPCLNCGRRYINPLTLEHCRTFCPDWAEHCRQKAEELEERGRQRIADEAASELKRRAIRVATHYTRR